MSTDRKPIEVGQVWRRKAAGVRVRVERVIHYGVGADLDIAWPRLDRAGRGAVFKSNFRKRYELLEEAA